MAIFVFCVAFRKQRWRWPGKTAGIMIRSRVNLWCRDHDPGSFCVAGIILVVAQEIPAAICNPWLFRAQYATPRLLYIAHIDGHHKAGFRAGDMHSFQLRVRVYFRIKNLTISVYSLQNIFIADKKVWSRRQKTTKSIKHIKMQIFSV